MHFAFMSISLVAAMSACATEADNMDVRTDQPPTLPSSSPTSSASEPAAPTEELGAGDFADGKCGSLSTKDVASRLGLSGSGSMKVARATKSLDDVVNSSGEAYLGAEPGSEATNLTCNLVDGKASVTLGYTDFPSIDVAEAQIRDSTGGSRYVTSVDEARAEGITEYSVSVSYRGRQYTISTTPPSEPDPQYGSVDLFPGGLCTIAGVDQERYSFVILVPDSPTDCPQNGLLELADELTTMGK